MSQGFSRLAIAIVVLGTLPCHGLEYTAKVTAQAGAGSAEQQADDSAAGPGGGFFAPPCDAAAAAAHGGEKKNDDGSTETSSVCSAAPDVIKFASISPTLLSVSPGPEPTPEKLAYRENLRAMLSSFLCFLTALVVFDGVRQRYSVSSAHMSCSVVDEDKPCASSVGTPVDFESDFVTAVQAGDAARCSLLLAQAIPGDTVATGRDRWGCSVLHSAVNCGKREIVEMLLDNGADMDVLDVMKEGPIHLAARTGNLEVCHILLERGAVSDGKNVHGNTPLLVAGHAGQKDICEFLIDYGCGITETIDVKLPVALAEVLAGHQEAVLTIRNRRWSDQKKC